MPHRGGGSCDAGDRRPFSSGDDFQSLVFWITSCVLLIFLNTFFTFRTQPLTISAILMQILVLPIGRFMAATLPTDHYNFFGWRFSLNPGPFNMKEYVIITIFANCGVSTGGGDAYSISAITVLLGYGWAGILRRYLVDPVDMWWPSNFAQVSLFRFISCSLSFFLPSMLRFHKDLGSVLIFSI
ncbi:hypothetical protein HN51_063070 [Arachis hypogaea]